MIFEETKLRGAYVIKPERLEDERGFFARSFCLKEFAEHGLSPFVVQCNISYNKKKGTFRGMHFQAPPFEEDKIVCCTQGSILDYVVDLRLGSPTFKQWVAVELSAENRNILYIPKTFAHGFITLTNDTQVFYQMTQFYNAESARGFRWDDPAFDIQLPIPVESIAEKDRSFPPFEYPSILFSSAK
ncbi:dTDP-4-dehydrorhamnose 3,5-epimerase [Fulvivirga sp. 29W222]|uniref:dTDP-4-dehydrorhamnose 3,5-epimerase n=1 Tax=Fulvivirga marina TaxID=2494733 RepID=A0A937G458_9BACT|nr:dTDP-4-dehydrorhamnose 3,5-epimerase [Fulvivirga marina]MBL6448106.1 dTDP-4-dehydrorhamnose 3,5-epimerase [Fulvivirga marina]